MNPKKHKPEVLNFTTKAIAHFKHKLSAQGKENKIRLGVKKSGCNGFSYYFEFVSRGNKTDKVIKVDDMEFFIPSDSIEILSGSQVDFTIEGLNQGIKFINPNASAVCGCGESFTVNSLPEKDGSNNLAAAQKKKLKILPHKDLCPDGLEFDLEPDETILDACLRNGIRLEHACEKACACTTCHVIVKEGFENLEDASDEEEDLLDKAWGLQPNSRLSCQAYPVDEVTVIEIPKYTINQVSELT